jgi:excisionase family DNA binding protein
MGLTAVKPQKQHHAQTLRVLTIAQLMTPEQCAEFLQLEVPTLYTMKHQGRIPFRKVGHLLRFDFDEIVEWTKRV